MRGFRLLVCLSVAVSASLLAAPDQAATFLPVDEVRPGMEGVGRTVFAGDQIEEFKVHIIGVLKNVTAPQHDLVLARLEGGPLERTGVIQGMSGSPVYVNGKLLGAVSYALGSFPKEPLAGITPISEMVSAASNLGSAPRLSSDLALTWPATPSQVFAALGRLSARAALGGAPPSSLRVIGPASLADLAPSLRPIGAAMVLGGFDPDLDGELRRTLNATGGPQQSRPAENGSRGGPLRPGDAVGMALMRGDLEMGATGTVTHVDGNRVYAFGHPFLNMGPTTMPMTRARVVTVLPSLDSSMKIATLGPMIGTISQDRSTGIAGTTGTNPPELDVDVTLKSDRAADRRMQFKVLHDQTLTPLFAYVAILNALAGFERQSGVLTVETSGDVSFGAAGTVTVDDVFSGDTAASSAAAAATAAVGMAAANEFRPALAERLSLTLRVREVQEYTTIERVWLDTVRPRAGATHTLNVLVRDYRGGTETVTMPVTLPAQTTGTLTLLVTDGQGLTSLEDRDLRPGKPTNWQALLTKMNGVRKNNRIYVRLLTSSAGTVVAGETLPSLPASVRSVFDEDKTVATAPVAKSVVGSWEQRMNRMVRGSRELTLNVTSR
jgi:hypothetical protein